MGTKTTYEIELRYLLDDRAVRGAASLSRQLQAASRSSGSLDGAIKRVGASIVAYFGIREAAGALIGFNAQMDQLKIQMSAIIQLNLGGTFEGARVQAEGLVKEFQRFAVLTPVTTKDVTEFGARISAAVFGAGGGMKEFINITEQGVIASKVFGAEANYAAIELTELLQGVVNKRMRFAMQLLHAAHVDEEHFRAMTAAERMRTIQGVLNSDAMKSAATAYSQSFAGVTSTLVDNLQILLGKVGLPLFKAITAEVMSWNQWINENERVLATWAKGFGEALHDGFKLVKDVLGWIVDHKEVLLSVAKAWLIMKGAGSLASPQVGAGAFGKVAMQAQNLGLAFAALYAATSLLTDLWEVQQDNVRRAQSQVGPEQDYLARMRAGTLSPTDYQAMLRSAGIREGFIRPGQVAGTAARYLAAVSEAYGGGLAGESVAHSADNMRIASDIQLAAAKMFVDAANQGAIQQAVRQQADKLLVDAVLPFTTIMSAMYGPWASGEGMKMLPRPEVNVTIQRIEVHSDDPDRFSFALVTALKKAARNPSGARDALREL